MAGSGERGDDVDVGIILLIKLNAFCKSVGLRTSVATVARTIEVNDVRNLCGGDYGTNIKNERY